MGFLAALQTMSRMLEVTERILNLFQSREMNAWLGEVENAIDTLQKAETQEQKFVAARTMVHIIRNLK